MAPHKAKIKLFDSKEAAFSILEEGIPRLVRYKTREICVLLADGQFLAFVNQCPHRGASLHQGTINSFFEISCPLHYYRFNLKTGDETSQRCPPLEFIEVLIEEDGLFLLI